MVSGYSELLIDLDSICHNYRCLSLLAAPARCGAVLKADAYGLGLERIAPCLAKAGCRDFFVAYMDEALSLRSFVDKSARIFLLNGPYARGWSLLCRQHCLIPVLNEMNTLREALHDCVEYALHVDTGINRLGLSYRECLTFMDEILEHPPSYLISHLTSSEEKESEHNSIQLKRFEEIASFFPAAQKSLCNSSGIFLEKKYHFDLVRPGIALYGMMPDVTHNLRFPLTLRAQILQIYSLEKGETVGYNQTFQAFEPMKLATVALGYADGLPWRSGLLATTNHFQNKQVICGAYWNEQFLPIVGRISMDLTSVDITNIDGFGPEIGDFITFLSSSCNMEAWTSLVRRSHYELPLRMGKRLKRVYLCQETSQRQAMNMEAMNLVKVKI